MNRFFPSALSASSSPFTYSPALSSLTPHSACDWFACFLAASNVSAFALVTIWDILLRTEGICFIPGMSAMRAINRETAWMSERRSATGKSKMRRIENRIMRSKRKVSMQYQSAEYERTFLSSRSSKSTEEGLGLSSAEVAVSATSELCTSSVG